MCNAFCEVADLAAYSEDIYEKVMVRTNDLKGELKEEDDVCGSNKPISIDTLCTMVLGYTSSIAYFYSCNRFCFTTMCNTIHIFFFARVTIIHFSQTNNEVTEI